MLEPGAVLHAERYRIVRQLGAGGQATTFEAVDAREGRPVAIKRFAVRGAPSWKEVELAEREARVLESLDHPLVPRFVEHFEEEGALYLVTELVEGESLQALGKRGRHLSRDDVLDLLRDLASALRYLHGRAPPVIHRDIKPGNVMRRKDGRFVLVDFGAVRAKLDTDGGSTVVGTFGYMAPEQFQGRALPQTDVYAAGATALAVLTGKDPGDLPHQGLRVDVRAALGGSDGELGRVLAAMLEPDPSRRPAEIEPLLARLRKARGKGRGRDEQDRASHQAAGSARAGGSKAAPDDDRRARYAGAEQAWRDAGSSFFEGVATLERQIGRVAKDWERKARDWEAREAERAARPEEIAPDGSTASSRREAEEARRAAGQARHDAHRSHHDGQRAERRADKRARRDAKRARHE
ncbi:MAG: serine/threonine-protein kinase, partial [Polyangiaceae bacterium]